MKVRKGKEISAINTPLVFPGKGSYDYEDISAFCREGVHYLIVSGKDGMGITASRDLRRWQEIEPLFPEVGEGKPGQVAAFGGKYYFCCLGREKDSREMKGYLAALEGEKVKESSRLLPLDLPFKKTSFEELSAPPLLLADEEDPGKLWCLYQDGELASAWTRDLVTWQEEGRAEFPADISGTVIAGVTRKDGSYVLVSSCGEALCRTESLETLSLTPYGGEALQAPEKGRKKQDKKVFCSCSILWDEELSLYVRYGLPEKGKGSGSQISLGVSRDLKHWQEFCRDRATAPERGVIYDGDYYRALPFGEYLHKETLPEGVPVFDIRDYGAIADGATLCTEPFMAAAEAARDAGGGIVLVAGGHFCVGSVWLYDNTTLWIAMDSALCASKNLDNYDNALLACVNAKNVCIRGGGKLIGNGEYFAYLPLKRPLLDPLPKTKLPPRLYDPMGYPVDTIRYAYRARIRYAEDKYAEGLSSIDRPMYTLWVCGCQDVTIENVVIEDALDWTLVLDGSQRVQVKDVVINGNRHVANTDGIDIMGSSQVEITHCFVSCADDGICIKSPRRREHDGIEINGCQGDMKSTRDIHISDCTVVSVMNAFKIGTETYFDIENVTMERCKFMLPDIFPGTVSGISIESADGAFVRNIQVRDIEMNRVCGPLFICLNMRNKYGSGDDREERSKGGVIENVRIENISAQEMEVPGIITGFRTEEGDVPVEGKVKDIQIRDFYGIYRDNVEELSIADRIYENIKDYPENNAFGDVPAYGLYIRHGENVTVEDCQIIPRSMNTRECIVWED